MQFATMAIASQAGQAMRKRELDDTERLRKQPTYWSQHDQAGRSCQRLKTIRKTWMGAKTAMFSFTSEEGNHVYALER